MRLIVVLTAIAMPLVAWLAQSGAFGPDQGTVSDQYPTLLVASGYAFAVWGLIFLLNLVYAGWQATGTRRADPLLRRIAPLAASGFFLTAIWMPLFSAGRFIACVVVIFAALATLVRCAVLLSNGGTPRRHLPAWLALSIHAGWLALAAFLDLAQTIVAFNLLPGDRMLGWSLMLWALAATVLLVLNRRMRGNLAWTAVALWGLVAVWVKQAGWTLPGSDVSAWVAAAIAIALSLQTAVLWWRSRAGSAPRLR